MMVLPELSFIQVSLKMADFDLANQGPPNGFNDAYGKRMSEYFWISFGNGGSLLNVT